jgi:hypothetical protein
MVSQEVAMEFRRVFVVSIACLVGVGALAASELRAEVVYGRPDGSMTLGGRVDLNQDGAIDFHLDGSTGCTLSIPGHCWSSYTIQGFNDPYDWDQGFNGNGILTSGALAASLTQGTPISGNVPGVEWLDGFGSLFIEGLTFDTETLSNPRPERPRFGYLGARFSATDGTHYGWMRVLLEPWWEPPYQSGGYVFHLQRWPEVFDWAYESLPDTPIVAGAVPESATWLLVFTAAAIIAGWKLRRRLLPFLICVLVPVAANGDIIHRTAARPGSWEPFDLDANGRLDLQFAVNWMVTAPDVLSIYFAIEQAGGAAAGNGVLTDANEVPPLPPGFVIGQDSQGLIWDDSFIARKIPDVSPAGSLLGHPPAPTTQFVGIRLRADDGWHYGWVRLAQQYWAPFDMDHPDWPDDTSSVPYFALPRVDTYNPGVIDWAYETTPDTPIIAGAVPEPGTIALVVVAIAFSCFFIGRRFLARPRGRGSLDRVHKSADYLSDCHSSSITGRSSFRFIFSRGCRHASFSHLGAVFGGRTLFCARGARRTAGGRLDWPRWRRRRRGLALAVELELGRCARQRH